MARNFSSGETKNVINEHRRLLNILNGVINRGKQSEPELRRQLNRLQSIGAFGNMVISEMRSGSPSMNGEMQRFAVGLSNYAAFDKLSAEANRILRGMQPRLDNELRDAQTGGNGLRWLFASSQKKNRAEEAYQYLASLLNTTYPQDVERLGNEAAALNNVTAEQALAQLTADRQSVRKTLKKLTGSEVIPRDFNTLLQQVQALQNRLGNAQQASDNSREAVRSCAAKVQEREALKILEGVPVDELNREKDGIRVKTLRDSGYQTMADIYRATPQQLTSVNGISAEGAEKIKHIAKLYLNRSRKGAHVRLSADDRNPESTALVCAVYDYRRKSEAIKQAQSLQEQHGKQIEAAVKTLGDVGSGAAWLTYTPDEKSAVAQSYQYLQSLLKSDYAGTVANVEQLLRGQTAVSPQAAWADFQSDPIAYSNLLDELAPGVLGDDDSVYGLPEELALEIAAQEVLTDGLRCTLRPYQLWGVKYILHQKRVLLGDEMGLGKTVQAIASMVSLRNEGQTHFMVVCPASVISNWCREIEKHSDLSVTKIHGADRAPSFANWKEKGGVAVTTFETTAHLEMEDSFRFAMLTVDEAHYIKNPEANRTKSVRAISEHAERLLFMTGTALENKVDEMLELVKVLRLNLANELQSMAFMSSAPQFRETVAPVYYRRKRADVLKELPELVQSEEWCRMSSAEERAYENAVLSGNYAQVRRVSWEMPNTDDSVKANRLKEIVTEAEQEERKIIVFSFFLDTIGKVCSMFSGKCIGPINGSVPPQRRQEMIDEFDKAPAGTVLAAQIQSGGTGLNIQSASVVVLCEPQFKPSVENQAISRAYRMGQSRSVLVYRLLCENTADEKIMKLLEQKQQIFDAFADDSAVADETYELDEKGFGEIMEEEKQRILEKYGDDPPTATESGNNEQETLDNSLTIKSD